QVLASGKLAPNQADAGDNEAELEALVDAVGCHARSVVLLAPQVVGTGVRRTTQQLREIMVSLEVGHRDDRERSLLAGAMLSLRRLSPEMRGFVRQLSVFRGGASLLAIRVVLKLDLEQTKSLVREMEKVGIAAAEDFDYVRFDPALLGGLEGAEREAALAA